MGSYKILDEVRVLADEYGFEKPDNISEGSWRVASFETKYIHSDVKRLLEPLEDAYWQAVGERDWERALLLYQRLVGQPHFSIDPELFNEQERSERESEFITRAREWIKEAEWLLRL